MKPKTVLGTTPQYSGTLGALTRLTPNNSLVSANITKD